MLKHWMRLRNGINASTPIDCHLTGNSPELMPMDYFLSEDWVDGLKRHQLRATNRPEDNPNTFASSAPKRLLSSVRRVWEGHPSSERIAQDTRKVTRTNMPTAHEHQGVFVPGIGNRRGKKRHCRKETS